jgi:hypothetical protein
LAVLLRLYGKTSGWSIWDSCGHLLYIHNNVCPCMHNHPTHETASLINSEVIIMKIYSPLLHYIIEYTHMCRQYVAVAHGCPTRTQSPPNLYHHRNH